MLNYLAKGQKVGNRSRRVVAILNVDVCTA